MLRRTHRLRHALLTSLMLVFALCLAVQPVLGALGEMHELSAHATTANEHHDHLTPHEDVTQTGDGAQEQEGGLHQLLHYTHCCGHTVALATGESATTILPLASNQVLPSVSPQAAASHLTNPFRPPIQA